MRLGCAKVAPATASLACSNSSASFVGFVVTSTDAFTDGRSLVVYTVAARFDGPTDTVYRAFDLTAARSAWYYGFWHKDSNTDLSDPVLSQSDGSWDPRRTGSSSSNRPYDSYLTIGGIANGSDTTRDGYDDILGTQLSSSGGWDRAALPSASDFEWFNGQPGNQQGRAGNSPGLPSTDVRVGQFVLSAGHAPRTFSLSLKFNSGDWFDRDGDGESDDMTVATGSFTLGVPAPGALGVLLLGSFARGRRRG